MKKNFN